MPTLQVCLAGAVCALSSTAGAGLSEHSEAAPRTMSLQSNSAAGLREHTKTCCSFTPCYLHYEASACPAAGLREQPKVAAQGATAGQVPPAHSALPGLLGGAVSLQEAAQGGPGPASSISVLSGSEGRGRNPGGKCCLCRCRGRRCRGCCGGLAAAADDKAFCIH